MPEKSKHLQGPWELAWEDGKHGVIAHIDGEPKFIAVIYQGDDKSLNDVRKANAMLMTASPDLLDACQSALQLQEWICEKISKIRQAVDNGQAIETTKSYEELTFAMHDGFLASHRDEYEQAIAKARGEA